MTIKNSNYKNFSELPLMMSVPDVASVLGISRAGAYELVHRSDFPTMSIGTRIIVPREQFVLWVNRKLEEKGWNNT